MLDLSELILFYVRPLFFDSLFNEHLESKARIKINKMWKLTSSYEQ